MKKIDKSKAVVGNYTPPKPLEKRIPYEEANAPIMANPFHLILFPQKDVDFINWDVVNAERAKQDTTHYQVACQNCELGKSGTCPHRR